jgi:hypothetical protein
VSRAKGYNNVDGPGFPWQSLRQDTVGACSKKKPGEDALMPGLGISRASLGERSISLARSAVMLFVLLCLVGIAAAQEDSPVDPMLPVPALLPAWLSSNLVPRQRDNCPSGTCEFASL